MCQFRCRSPGQRPGNIATRQALKCCRCCLNTALNIATGAVFFLLFFVLRRVTQFGQICLSLLFRRIRRNRSVFILRSLQRIQLTLRPRN